MNDKLRAKMKRAGIKSVKEACQYTENEYMNMLRGFNSKDLEEIKAMAELFSHRLRSPVKNNSPIEMGQSYFDSLDDYSCTLPSGTYVGKRWKRRTPYRAMPHSYFENYKGRLVDLDQVPTWTMGEFYDIGSADSIGINWRPIVVVNSATVFGELLKMIPSLWPEVSP